MILTAMMQLQSTRMTRGVCSTTTQIHLPWHAQLQSCLTTLYEHVALRTGIPSPNSHLHAQNGDDSFHSVLQAVASAQAVVVSHLLCLSQLVPCIPVQTNKAQPATAEKHWQHSSTGLLAVSGRQPPVRQADRFDGLSRYSAR